MMICPVCELSGGPFNDEEATLHLVTHNRFHHAVARTAVALTAALRRDHPLAA
jgi:hypothetical protein